MGKYRPGTKGWIKTVNGTLMVGAEDLSDPKNPYRGPIAEVEWDDNWLHITTDPYEGSAMLNIEALPYLRKALAQVARALKDQSQPTGGDSQ